MPKGYLQLVLHAHLPYVRHPEFDRFLEERWFFEAVTETYIPLIKFFDRLRDEGHAFKVTLSVSPTLANMMEDPLLRERCVRHLDLSVGLAEQAATKATVIASDAAQAASGSYSSASQIPYVGWLIAPAAAATAAAAVMAYAEGGQLRVNAAEQPTMLHKDEAFFAKDIGNTLKNQNKFFAAFRTFLRPGVNNSLNPQPLPPGPPDPEALGSGD